MSELYVYDRFEVGKLVGSSSETVGELMLGHWACLYPWDVPAESGPVPAGLLSVLMMRIYQTVLAGRPPGNIHGSQKFVITALPEPGETVDGSLRCLSKTPRGERRFIDFEFSATGRGGRALFTGVMTMIWAA